MLFFSCRHKHWGDANENGIQHCTNCNLARYVVKECEHKYELFREYKETVQLMTGGTHEAMIVVSRCPKCGDIKEKRLS